MTNRALRTTLIVFLAIVVVGAIMWSFLAHRTDLEAEAQSDQPIKNATRVTRSNGEVAIKFDRETQRRMGIRTQVAVALTKRKEVVAYGRLEEDPSRSFVLRAPVAGTVQTVSDQAWPDIGQSLTDRNVVGVVDPRLPPTDRINLNDRLASAKADVESSRAALAAAQAALERARKLNADDKNVSDRAVQDAEARAAAEQARLSAATESVRLIGSSLTSAHDSASPLELLHGGEVIELLAHPGESVESGQPILRVARFDQLLARVDVPAGEMVAPNSGFATIVPLGQEDHPIRAERIALAAAIDPRTQGQPFLFHVSDRSSTLRPGLSVTAYLDVPGPARAGIALLRSAVVRESGRSWIYVQTSGDQFERRAVTLEEPVNQGWFTQSVSPGERIVVVGAQTLLSEEFKSQIQVEDSQ
jgi:hypothetical protein